MSDSSLTSGAKCLGKWIVLLLLTAISCFGSRGTGLSTQKVGAFAHGVAATTHFAIADFDGDSQPDLATVETELIGASHARYWIGLQMSAGAREVIGVNGPVGGLELASRDVNGDSIADLVVSAAWLKSPIAVLVNDGHGNFTIRDPAAFSASLTNPNRTLGPPNQSNPDTMVALSARISRDFIVTDGVARPAAASLKISRSNYLGDAFPLAVCGSGRAPPLSVHYV